MSWTKRQLIAQAFEEIGLANYVFDLTPDQLQSAAQRMDAMIASWGSIGARIAYPLSTSPNTTDIDADTTVPDFCNEAIYSNLALRLGPTLGKNISPDTRVNARLAYLRMVDRIVDIPSEYKFPSRLPRGQGTKPWRTYNSPFFIEPVDNEIANGPDSILNF